MILCAASGLRLRPPERAATLDYVFVNIAFAWCCLIKYFFVDLVLEKYFTREFRCITHTPTHAKEFFVDAPTRCYLSVACARVSLCF